jgi:hypothetical protein
VSRASLALRRFFFEPASPAPLAALRIGLAAALLLQAGLCAGQYFEWYGSQGLLQTGVAQQFAWGIPQTARLAGWLAPWGISEGTLLSALGLGYGLALIALGLGWRTRTAAILSWLAHTLLTQQHLTSYGFDLLAQVMLFYLLWAPSGRAWSVDVWRGRARTVATPLTRLSLRVCQLQLAIVYLSSGLEKASGRQWWNGEAIWRSLMLPIYRQWDLERLAWFPWIAVLIGWGTLAIEIGYPFLIFPRRTRRLWLGLTCLLHAGIAVFLGLHLFALLMAILSLALFGVPAEGPPLRLPAARSPCDTVAIPRTPHGSPSQENFLRPSPGAV